MKTKLIDFNRRGAICAFNTELTTDVVKTLSDEERVIMRAVGALHARYFVVMKRIDAEHMLVAPVYDAKRRNCKTLGINCKRYWVNFMTFYVVPERVMQAVPGKYLDYPYRTISAIYTSHNNVLKEKWRRENEQRILDQEIRRQDRERKYHAHRYNMDHLYPVPEYLQEAACHPYAGGRMSGR